MSIKDDYLKDMDEKTKEKNDKYFKDQKERSPVWNPKEGDIIDGTIVDIQEFPEMYNGSILATIDTTDKGKIAWWLSTVPREQIAKLSGYKYTKGDFETIVTACKLAVGKGVAIRYEGMAEGKNYEYKLFRVVPAPSLDRKLGDSPVAENGEKNGEKPLGDF